MIGIRDRRVVPFPSKPAPAAGATYVQDDYGAEVLRVTGDGKSTHYYSWSSPTNANDTRLLVMSANQPVVYAITSTPLSARRLGTLAELLTPGVAPPRLNPMSSQWHPTEPNTLYVPEAALISADGSRFPRQRINVIDLATGTCAPLRRFNTTTEIPDADVDALCISQSGKVFAFLARRPDQTIAAACVWNRATDKLVKFPVPAGATPIHGMALSRDGQWAMVAMSNPTPDLYFWRWADTGPPIKVAATDPTRNGILNHVFMGRTALFAGSPDGNGVSTRWYEDFGAVRTVLPSIPWAVAQHLSAPPDEQSVILSTYLGEGGALGNEIIEAAVDGSWFRRLASTHSRGRLMDGGSRNFLDLTSSGGPNDYGRQARAACSTTGALIIWTSDLGGDGTDVLMMRRPRPDAELALIEDRDQHVDAAIAVASERDEALAQLAAARTDLVAARISGEELRTRMLQAIAALGVP